MTTTKTLLLEQQPDGVAVITFNRPAARNALDLDTMQQFYDAVAALAQQTTLRCVILTGAGEKAFCAGGDLVELSTRPTEADAHAFITTMGDALLQLEQLPVPVIAAINGYALGGGSEIAMACDLRIVDQSVKMGFVQVNLALTPGWGAGQRLLRTVGYAQAMEILLRGQPMTAHELTQRGLVNQVVTAGEALAAAREFAAKIASLSPDVVRAIKALLQAGRTQPYLDALQTERALFPPLWAAEPHLAAVEAFLKR